MDYLSIYVKFTFIIKILFMILAFYSLYLKHKYLKEYTKEPTSSIKTNDEILFKYNNAIFWKDRVEFIFVSLMSFLLLYLFIPFKKHEMNINYEIKLLLFLFGIILIINANWKLFFNTSPIYNEFQFVV